MAVKIRLKRMGAKKRPFYRVVVADARSPRDGRFIESIGYYDPLKDPKVFHVDDERIRHWMATGARPSDAVRELLERKGTLPATAHPVRTKTGPRRAPKPGRAPVASVSSSAPSAEASEEASQSTEVADLEADAEAEPAEVLGEGVPAVEEQTASSPEEPEQDSAPEVAAELGEAPEAADGSPSEE